MPHPFLAAVGLPGAWSGQPAWRVLDTQWQDGTRFLASWRTWRADPKRPRLLHYVAICQNLPSPDDLHRFTLSLQALQADQSDVGCEDLVNRWVKQTQDLQTGFTRLAFEAGQVLLTLCIGDLQPMLQAQRFVADSVFLPQFGGTGWRDWTVQALLQSCQLGTLCALQLSDSEGPTALRLLERPGFQIEGTGHPNLFAAGYSPAWPLKTSRRSYTARPIPAGQCVVVGAGLAGASVAASLARRGWQVQVLDAANTPAAGASGLPVGLMAASPSQDNSVRSRCLAAGIRLTTDQARQLLAEGQDWASTGVMTCKPATPALWQHPGIWLKPHRLVNAWLAGPGIVFKGQTTVASIQAQGMQWLLRDAARRLVAAADLVVLACASGTSALASPHNAPLVSHMQTSRGQISWALHGQPMLGDISTDFPRPFTANGHGHLIAQVPWGDGLAWFTGSTYVVDATASMAEAEHHAANLARLQVLHPAAANRLACEFERQTVNAWQGNRFASIDHMPVVGQWSKANQPNLCISTGFGSRGLSWSVLCAELLAANLAAEPLPLEGRLTLAMDCKRFLA